MFSEEIIQYLITFARTFAPQVQTPWNQAHAPREELSKDTKNTI